MSCHWATNNVGTWFYGDSVNGVWSNCEMSFFWNLYYHDFWLMAAGTIPVACLLIAFTVTIGEAISAVFVDRPGGVPSPSTHSAEIRSSINVPAIIQQKMAPPPTSTMPPPVQQMTYAFGDPLHDDDHTVRFYLALSQEEAATVKKRA